MRSLRALLVAALATLAFPAASLAATGSADVTAVVAPELSISAANVALPALSHAGPNTWDTGVKVTSTGDWTLTAEDPSDPATGTKGLLLRTSGTGPLSLTQPLSVDLGSGGNSASGDLTGSLGSVSGSLVQTVPAHFSQVVTDSDAIHATDSYGMTVTYTATPAA
jgi:hypothetical protein